MAGKRITKKKLKQPDEFISLTEHAYLFISRHLKKIATAAVIVLIVVLAVFLYQKWEQGKEADASQKFGLALQKLGMASAPSRQGSPVENKDLLQMFEEIILKYPRTSAGKLSLLYKGNILLQAGQFDDAIKAYDSFLQKAGKDQDQLFRSFAWEGLGYAYEGKKDYEKALNAYQKILEAGGSFETANAHLDLGRCYEKLGKNKEAVEQYQAFVKSSPKSSLANAVLRKISLLEK